ncbi:hypothetical protein CCR75_003708 [Bremia lactucae]|uniref:RING-type E3 ubiquitin transferase n=1 Tax=Bremia lactucae TaxID=4779 RepID=A0A976NZC1_BRELC|nr:hypothetical protein CCR75_003708 [Bremia lactucae]
MSLGNRVDSEAAAHDESEWVSRGEAEALITTVTTQITVAPPASSNGQVIVSSEDELDPRAADLAVLGDTCSICLQMLEDPVMLTTCHHVYCFECLSTWSHSQALHGVEVPTCPLCKNSFQEVYANVRSEVDFELLRFQGRCIRDQTGRPRLKDHNDCNQERLRRRSLVYRRHMRLARVANQPIIDSNAFPRMHKVKGEYEVWMKRELRACIGRDVDVTVLIAIIECCLNKVSQCGPQHCYSELQNALSPFLYDDASHFVRELAFFLGSRLNVDAYDDAVEYRCESASECSNALCCGG